MVRIHLLRKDLGGVMNRPRGRTDLPTVLISFGRHIVYAEGTKTEPRYVEDLKVFVSEQLGVKKEDIEIIPVKMTKSQHTVDLVNFAIEDVKRRRLKNESIDYVWVFYDKDDYQDFDDAYRIIKKQNVNDNETEWFACWSNECFEVWVYHYFENLETPIEREQYIKKINAFLKRNKCPKEYKKNMEGLHHFLTQYGGDIRKATQLMKNKDVGSDIKPNPSSGIYQFAEFILAYIDDKMSEKT